MCIQLDEYLNEEVVINFMNASDIMDYCVGHYEISCRMCRNRITIKSIFINKLQTLICIVAAIAQLGFFTTT